jgi:hypothetical protein
MDRDAPNPPPNLPRSRAPWGNLAGPVDSPASPADAVPPYAPESVRLVGLVGVGLCAAAAVLSGVCEALASAPAALNSARAILCFVGVVTAGAALSMRPDLWWAWALGSVAAALGVVGLPVTGIDKTGWDSFVPLFRVLSGLGAIGAALSVAPLGWRVAVSAAAILFHFSGIFMAATSPPPRPWVTEQLFTRVYNPYLQFVYLRNAYQFYSPNPGPASIVVFLLKTETTDEQGRKSYKTQWVVTPRRPADVKDPLGLSYYRRLSLTQQISGGNFAFVVPTEESEKKKIFQRRYSLSGDGRSPDTRGHIPFFLGDPMGQYALPTPEAARFIIPSYASHVIVDTLSEAEAGKTTVKVYRLEHMTTPVEQFVHKMDDGTYPDPYAPSTYRPYFLGEYNAHGELINPQEPFLYWLIPIYPRMPSVGEQNPKPYLDYLSAHALDMTVDEVLRADVKDGRVFNWGQLRWSETR